MRIRDPLLNTVDPAILRPTQITVGLREVKAKRRAWRDRHDSKKAAAHFLGSHMVQVICGPDEHLYVTDHHHLVRALIKLPPGLVRPDCPKLNCSADQRVGA